MKIIEAYRSNRGNTIFQHIIEENPSIKSLAAGILLNESLRLLDEDFLNEHKEIQEYLDERHKFLNKKLEKCGDLQCHYCKEKRLQIGHRLAQMSRLNNAIKNLATIDHVEPISSGIDKMDKKNWVVACRRCNKLKGSMSYIDFLKILPEIIAGKKPSSKKSNRKQRRLHLQPELV